MMSGLLKFARRRGDGEMQELNQPVRRTAPRPLPSGLLHCRLTLPNHRHQLPEHPTVRWLSKSKEPLEEKQ
jgi:hypothetical protein